MLPYTLAKLLKKRKKEVQTNKIRLQLQDNYRYLHIFKSPLYIVEHFLGEKLLVGTVFVYINKHRVQSRNSAFIGLRNYEITI